MTGRREMTASKSEEFSSSVMKHKDRIANTEEGKRRRFFRELLLHQAVKKFLPNPVGEPLGNEAVSSEYIDEFCREKFVPILDKMDVLTEKEVVYPLYASGPGSTIYNEKIMKELLKRRSTVVNLHEPFRKNSTFSTPVEDRLTSPEKY